MTVRELLRVLVNYEFEDEIFIAHARTGDQEAEYDHIVYVEDMNGPVLCSHEYRQWYIMKSAEQWKKAEEKPRLSLVRIATEC